MAADLAKLQQRIEKDDLCLLPADRESLADLLVHRRSYRLVEILLRLAHLDLVENLGLGRQLLGDIVFGAAENERSDPPGKGGAFGFAPAFFNGCLID